MPARLVQRVAVQRVISPDSPYDPRPPWIGAIASLGDCGCNVRG